MVDSSDTTPIYLTPIKLSESISSLSFQIVWPEGYVDLTKSVLSKEELERLLIHLKRNIKIGSILFNEEQDRFDYTFCKVIKRLRKNNQIFNYHPSDYMCGVIAGHIYCASSVFQNKKSVDFRDIPSINIPRATASQLESINEYLSKLEIIRFLNEDGFQFAIYENKEMHHLIMAFRGTVPTNLREAAYTMFEDVVGITLKDRNSFQQRMVFKVVKEAVEICKSKHYNLTIVGHSLGAWLSELAHYDCFYNHNFKHVKTVTFDSPGALDQFKVIDNYKEPVIPYNCMNIVSYLSEPNIVNSMNNHIFDNDTTYRIYPAGVEQIDTMKLDFIISAKFHVLGSILDTFDFETGKPREYKIVKKWPLIKISNLSIYFSYFEKNDNGALEKPNNPYEDEVHYDVEVVNPYGGILALDRFRIDEIIHQLSIKNYFYEFSDYFISTQLKELKSLFEIQDFSNQKSLCQITIKNQTITYEQLKQRVSRVVNLNPKEIIKVLTSNDQDYKPKEYKIRVNHTNNEGFFDPDNYLEKIEKILENNNIVILTGEEGSGKSTIALEYALKQFPISKNYNNPINNQPFKNHKLLYIHGNSKEMIYEDFANHLLKNYQNEQSGPKECGTTYDFQLSSNNLIDFYKVIMDSQDTCYMFIFDNVQDLSVVEPFLFYMPKLNTRAIVTCQVEKRKSFFIERTLSLTKQSTKEIVLNINLLTNEQANRYLKSRGIHSNCNFDSPISIHLLNILVNHFNKEETETETIDFSKTLSNLIREFIKINPDSNQLLSTLAFLDPESISYQVLAKIQQDTLAETIKPMENIKQYIKYWSDVSVINDFETAEKVNTYKYIQQLIRNEIITEADKEKVIHRIQTVFSNLDLKSSHHPKGWRIYFNHLRYLYDNFKDLCTIKMIENLGICYRLTSSYQESINFLNESLEMKKESSQLNCLDQEYKNDISESFFQIGFSFQKNEDFSNALSSFNLILKNSDKLEMISKTYNQIGLCNFKLGLKEESLEWYEKSLSIEKSKEGLSSVHLNLGDYYLSKNDIKNAKNEFLMALNLIESNSNEICPILVKSNFKLSLIEFLEFNFKVSIEKFEKTIQLYKELFKSSHHADIATSFEKIGLSYLKDANILIDPTVLLNSLKNLQESLNIRLKIHRTNLTHKDIGESYNNLGVCYKKRLEYKESFNCFLKSYNIQKSNCENLVPILESLSTSSYLLKDYQTSINYSNKLIKILEEENDKIANSNSIMKVAIAFKNIGENYRLLNLKQESISNFQKSLEILENHTELNQTKFNINNIKQLKNEITNNNDSLISIFQIIELIGSIYYNLNQLEDSKNKNYKIKLQNYFEILKSFQSLSPEKSKFLDNSNWFIEYKNSKSNSFFTIDKIIIISSILLILISYYNNQNSNNTK